MKTINLVGGWGTRLGQVPEVIVKPMVPIGGKPSLRHTMKNNDHYGNNES